MYWSTPVLILVYKLRCCSQYWFLLNLLNRTAARNLGYQLRQCFRHCRRGWSLLVRIVRKVDTMVIEEKLGERVISVQTIYIDVERVNALSDLRVEVFSMWRDWLVVLHTIIVLPVWVVFCLVQIDDLYVASTLGLFWKHLKLGLLPVLRWLVWNCLRTYQHVYWWLLLISWRNLFVL